MDIPRAKLLECPKCGHRDYDHAKTNRVGAFLDRMRCVHRDMSPIMHGDGFLRMAYAECKCDLSQEEIELNLDGPRLAKLLEASNERDQ